MTGAPFFLGQCLQCLVKFSPGVGPTGHHPDFLWQFVVALVAVHMEPSREVLEKSFRMLYFPIGPVFIQHNGLINTTTGSVHPHIGFSFEVLPGSFCTSSVVSSLCITVSWHNLWCSSSYTGRTQVSEVCRIQLAMVCLDSFNPCR